jgi:hypothetical protein
MIHKGFRSELMDKERRIGLWLVACAGSAALSTSAAFAAPIVKTLTGGNSDQGLNLSNAVAAVNFGDTTTTDTGSIATYQTIQGVTFVPEAAGGSTTINGITISNAGTVAVPVMSYKGGNGAATFSDSPGIRQDNDTALTHLANPLIYASTGNLTPTPVVTITLSGLDTTKSYMVDVIISDANIEPGPDASTPQIRGQTIALNNETPTSLYSYGPTIYDLRRRSTPPAPPPPSLWLA